MTINITVPALSPKALGLIACLAAMAISAIASAAEPVTTRLDCKAGKTTIVAQPDGTTKIVTKTVCEVN